MYRVHASESISGEDIDNAKPVGWGSTKTHYDSGAVYGEGSLARSPTFSCEGRWRSHSSGTSVGGGCILWGHGPRAICLWGWWGRRDTDEIGGCYSWEDTISYSRSTLASGGSILSLAGSKPSYPNSWDARWPCHTSPETDYHSSSHSYVTIYKWGGHSGSGHSAAGPVTRILNSCSCFFYKYYNYYAFSTFFLWYWFMIMFTYFCCG